MKKAITALALTAMFLALTFSLVAADGVNGNGNPDTTCQANGFDYGIAKYECGESEADELGSLGESYELTVSWNLDDEELPKIECTSVDWTADPAVDGIVSKEGDSSFSYSFPYPGETSGTIEKDGQNAISHITFCGNYEPPTVPEFGPMIAMITALGALGVFFLVRRK